MGQFCHTDVALGTQRGRTVHKLGSNHFRKALLKPNWKSGNALVALQYCRKYRNEGSRDRQPKALEPEPGLARDPLDPRIGSWPLYWTPNHIWTPLVLDTITIGIAISRLRDQSHMTARWIF